MLSVVLLSLVSMVLRAGVRKQAENESDNYEVPVDGLLPNTTYYYTAYLDLGEGVVYGEERSFTTPAAEFDPDNDLVDLGLSCKWAKYNVAATKATDLGGLFGFGDMTGYNTSIKPEEYASADIYKTSLDVANKVYGSWVTMPTINEFEELFSECTKEWTTEDGVAGYKLTGPNGNSIFLPAAGSRELSRVLVLRVIISLVLSMPAIIVLLWLIASIRMPIVVLQLLFIRLWPFVLFRLPKM